MEHTRHGQTRRTTAHMGRVTALQVTDRTLPVETLAVTGLLVLLGLVLLLPWGLPPA